MPEKSSRQGKKKEDTLTEKLHALQSGRNRKRTKRRKKKGVELLGGHPNGGKCMSKRKGGVGERHFFGEKRRLFGGGLEVGQEGEMTGRG